MTLAFDAPDLVEQLDAMPLDETDHLDFGLVVLDDALRVLWYNRHEAEMTGFDPRRVVGEPFFTAVAPCMNNFLVAHRFESEPGLDEELDYVFTVNLAPTPVRLRLLGAPDSERRYLAVRFRAA